MIPKVTIEVEAKHEAVVRQALAMVEEMEQLALTAAEGTVFHACEEAVIEKGRRLQRQVLGEAVTQRIETAEKKKPPAYLFMWTAERKQRPARAAPNVRRRRCLL